VGAVGGQCWREVSVLTGEVLVDEEEFHRSCVINHTAVILSRAFRVRDFTAVKPFGSVILGNINIPVTQHALRDLKNAFWPGLEKQS
jgi:hypothetical protein